MTEKTGILAMEAETNPDTGLVFYTCSEHLYTLGENVCQALFIAEDFTQLTGLTSDVGSASKDAALHTLSMMSYAVACNQGYEGTKEVYVAQALAHYEPMLDQYVKHEKNDLVDEEIAGS